VRGVCSEEARYYYNPSPTPKDDALAQQLAAEIESDEACTGQVFLFDRYLTPPEFRHYWEGLRFTPKILPGVLGQREEPGAARKRLNELLTQSHEQLVSADQPLVLISSGGTPVWDRLLEKIIDIYITRQPGNYLPVLSRPNVSDEYKDKMRRSGHIRWFEFPVGSTQQVLLPAFEVVVTRAGGGTVNDCLASQTPFVCVEEPQWQVRLIERECKALGLIPDLPETSWPLFQQDPVSCIETFVTAPRPVPKISVPGGAEKYLADVILSSL
jgi:predicted glycosyltransferase